MPPLSLAFDITARDSASPVLKRVGEQAERTGKKAEGLGSSVGRSMKTATTAVAGFGSSFAGIAGVIAGAGIVRGIGAVIGQARDLNETVNKSNVIFGANAREIDRWARGAARNLGLSRGAALEAAAGFGNMFTQLGFTGDAAAKMSEQVVQMSADLGSFNNLGTEDVAERISAAFRGEYDSLQLLIPNINAARVETEALAATGKQNADQLTAQEKAAAVLAIVQKDGAAAMGDFARTSGSLANQQKILNAEWENAQAQLGQLLLGPATGFVSWLSETLPKVVDLGRSVGETLGPALGLVGDALGTVVDVGAGAAGFFSSLPGPVQAVVAAMTAWALLKNPITSMLETAALKSLYLGDAVKGAATSVRGFKGALGDLVGSISPVTVTLAAATLAISHYVQEAGEVSAKLDAAADAGETFRSALAQQRGELDATAYSAAKAAVEAAGLADVLQDVGVSTGTVNRALAGNADAYRETLDALEEYDREQTAIRNAAAPQGIALDFLTGKAHENADAFRELTNSTSGFLLVAGHVDAGGFGDAMAAAAEATTATGDAAAATVPKVDEATEALERWRQELQGISAGFVEPLATYQQLLSEKQEAERRSAQATADATKSGKDSWEDYAQSVGVSLSEYADRLSGQIQAQDNWRANLVKIAQRGGVEVAQILADMGQDGVTLTAQMADGTDAEFRRMAELLIRDARNGGLGAATELDKALKVMAEVGRRGSRATAAAISRELGIGVDEVLRIAGQYGVNLARGVNPILSALGKPNVIPRIGQVIGFAAGGYTGDGGKYTPMGIVHGGEFVFTKEQTRKAGVGALEVWAKMLDGYAGGGFVSTSQVPRPPSTSPYRHPVSTPADAAMQREYTETVSWVAAQAAARAAAAVASSLGFVPGAPAAAGGNVGLVQSLAAARGWTGAQWNALYALIMKESGFRNTAQNPTSTAYGMFQFLDSTWASTGYGKTSDPRIQTLAGFNYIASRYGSPSAALSFHLAHNWYDQGGWLPPGISLAVNGTGRPERVVGPNERQNITVYAQFGDELIEAKATRVVEEAFTLVHRRGAYNA